MGKRSDFERINKDLYHTFDRSAGIALAPHVERASDGKIRYAEPCYGNGDLERNLFDADNGFDCRYQSDLSTGKDALDITEYDVRDCSYIITNPPWSRELLHPMIDHFSSLRPTWLLFDADWPFTVQTVIANKYDTKTVPELMKYCRKIVAVGRMKWIPGTNKKGKDNCAWYLFDKNSDGITEFVSK